MQAPAEISREEIERVASLAQLELDEVDAERLLGALRSILQYVENLKEVDVTGVEPMAHAVSI